jgi:putative endonuclease
MTGRNKRAIGTEGELIAVNFLKTNHYEILKTNFRVGLIGEIDIIAKDCEYICFIEVKTRSSYRFGTPGEAVNFQKQHKIKQIASIYLSNTVSSCKCVRFDVIEILIKSINGINSIENINHIKNAF